MECFGVDSVTQGHQNCYHMTAYMTFNSPLTETMHLSHAIFKMQWVICQKLLSLTYTTHIWLPTFTVKTIKKPSYSNDRNLPQWAILPENNVNKCRQTKIDVTKWTTSNLSSKSVLVSDSKLHLCQQTERTAYIVNYKSIRSCNIHTRHEG